MGGRTLAASGQQLFLIDDFRNTGKPLLSVLTDTNAIFIKALSLFKNRVLYANIVNDRSAPYYTTSISTVDPFEDLDLVDLNPIEGYGPTILDPVDPVKPKTREELGALTRFVASSSTFASQLPLMALIGVLAPIATVGFLANSGYQTFQSIRRMRLHHEDTTLGFKAYRFPLLLENAVKEVNGSLPAQKLNKDDDNNTSVSNPPSKQQIAASEKVDPESPTHEKSPFPTLALDPQQFEMIKNLNAIGWRKYGVHITKVRHSHAAIILRIERSGYQEGKTVIKHWVEEEFEI